MSRGTLWLLLALLHPSLATAAGGGHRAGGLHAPAPGQPPALQPLRLLQVLDVQRVLVQGGDGDRVLQIDTLQADVHCLPEQHVAWVRALLPPGTALWLEPAQARQPARLWLAWRQQRLDWALLLLRLGHALPAANAAYPARRLQSYAWAAREARAEGRGIWGECGRQRSRFGVAARVSGVPEQVLLAMALCESRLGGQPWPWTLNIAGTPYFFLTREAALRKLQQLQAEHFDLVDVGLMQVNWRYHSHRFRSLAEALDPDSNQVVAAHILREHLQRTGSLVQAIARYHSATPAHGAGYLAQVLRTVRGLAEADNMDRAGAPHVGVVGRGEAR